MTTEELRELDAWIAEHVMGWTLLKQWKESDAIFYTGFPPDKASQYYAKQSQCDPEIPCPTTDPAAAFEVLKRCVERLGHKFISVGFGNGLFHVDNMRSSTPGIDEIAVKAPTLELAICLFSKQLFSK